MPSMSQSTCHKTIQNISCEIHHKNTGLWGLFRMYLDFVLDCDSMFFGEEKKTFPSSF